MDNKIKNLRLLEEAKKMGAIIGSKVDWTDDKGKPNEEGEMINYSADEHYENIKTHILRDNLWIKHDKPFINDLIELKKLYDEKIITKEEYIKLYNDKNDEMDWYYSTYKSEQEDKENKEPEIIPYPVSNTPKEKNIDTEKIIEKLSSSILATATRNPIVERIFYGKDGRPMRN